MQRFSLVLCLAISIVHFYRNEIHAQSSSVKPDHAREMQAGLELFKSDVRPMMEKNCLECHGGKSIKGEVDIRTREALLAAKVLTSKADESTLYRVVAHLDEPVMPLKSPKLPAAEIEKLKRWIDLGAPYDKPLGDGKAISKEMVITDTERNYWAFRPFVVSSVPAIPGASTPIDAFIRQQWEKKGVKPAALLTGAPLLRRLSFDLTGLPPTPEEVQAFTLAKDPQKAYEDAVDRLLESPHYGERYARHWLDAARYAESHGFEHDYNRKNAYVYRDYVIAAFNRNQPIDEFLRWQIAGDRLAPNNPDAWSATGFLAAGVYPTQITTREAERIRYDAMDDMVATMGNAMLGLTVGCARCHDHKYDPIPTKDYYRLLSAFTETVRAEIEWDFGTPEEKAAMKAFEARLQPLTAARTKYEQEQLPEQLAMHFLIEEYLGHEGAWRKQKLAAVLQRSLERLSKEPFAFAKLDKNSQKAVIDWYKTQDAEWKKRQAAVQAMEKQRPKETKRLLQVATEGVKPMRHHTAVADIPDYYKVTHFLKRGDTDQKDGEAKPGVLQVLQKVETTADATPPRLKLAHWLTDTKEGAGTLAARVFVNRIWHFHFGRGIVGTINDFGLQGDKATHPELLDWLASDFVAHGWNLKRLHKQILMSDVYRLAPANKELAQQNRSIDPDNLLLWQRTARRLEAEALRDTLLAITGQLDRSLFGPGTLDESMKRRSIYFSVKRSQLIPFLQVFDWPDTLTSAGVRPNTIIAPQALTLLNNPHIRHWAKAWGDQLLKLKEPEKIITRAHWQAFGRQPDDKELSLAKEFLAAGDLPTQLTEYCLSLLSLNETIYTP